MGELKTVLIQQLPHKEYFAQCKNTKDVLVQFEKLLCDWEEEISKEHKKSYWTDEPERSIVGRVLEYLDCFLKNNCFENADRELCKTLFGHRHVGYVMHRLKNSFYQNRINDDSLDPLEVLKHMFADGEYREILYLSMADYYKAYHGCFQDNQEAIEYLCKFYPKQMPLNKGKEERIAAGLYPHVLLAGDSHDVGFAFQGISMIEKYFKYLNPRIVKRVLKSYERYRLENNPVHRHQVYSIISNSRIKNKAAYKFFYIDGLLLGKMINRLLYLNMEEESGGEYEYEYFSDTSFQEPWIVVRRKADQAPYVYWKLEGNTRMILMQENHSGVSRIFAMEEKQQQIILRYDGRTEILGIQLDDWVANRYFSDTLENSLAEFLNKQQRNGQKKQPDFKFSYVYLNHYRGLWEQKLSFDHRYDFDQKEKKLEKTKESPYSEMFYGKNVYSLSCIVGENGRGKTSIVDFLRNRFFKIKALVDQKQLGYSSQTPYFKEDQHDLLELEKNTEFLVIFRLEEKDFFLSNIPGLLYPKKAILPYSPTALLIAAGESAKIFYFSGKISICQKVQEADKTEDAFLKLLNQTHNVDYSEDAANHVRIRCLSAEGEGANRELCCQLAFLRYVEDQRLKAWFGEEFEKERFSVSGQSYGEDLDIPKLAKDPFAQLTPFSSGEYSKFSFLSKLYWCLEGREKCLEEFSDMKNNPSFPMKDVVSEGDTAVLFIDEGEVYYHPEWQRQFMQILLELVNTYSKSDSVQIILTTNSPFLISDILEEDVVYLPSHLHKSGGKAFGQNIHMLLKDSFFMKATIGEFARRRISWLLSVLKDPKLAPEELSSKVKDEFGVSCGTLEETVCFMEQLIESIGEEIYRLELSHMLDAFRKSESYQLEMLRKEKAELERKIEAIEKSLHQREET